MIDNIAVATWFRNPFAKMPHVQHVRVSYRLQIAAQDLSNVKPSSILTYSNYPLIALMDLTQQNQ
jgi:hypothetical protein